MDVSEPQDFVSIAVASENILYALDRIGRVWQYHPSTSGNQACWTILTNHRAGTLWRQQRGAMQPKPQREGNNK